MTQRLPTYFISHGGGPWPYLDGPFRQAFDLLEASLVAIRAELQEKPRAVLMVSSHWEEDGFAVSSGEAPSMVYDYYGFPELAARVKSLLDEGGIGARLDPERGYDHGTFSIMKPMYPEEAMPTVQLSIDRAYDPELHLQLGRLLAPLRDEGVLIIGSGLTYHNLSEIRGGGQGRAASSAFDRWLQDTLSAAPAVRSEDLRQWERAPMARAAHPREDHLIPLMAVVGAAETEAATTVYHQSDLFGGITASSFRFGALPS